MYKLLYIFFISIIVTNCSFKPVVKHHGVPYLEIKQAKLIVNETNKNDIKKILKMMKIRKFYKKFMILTSDNLNLV